MMRHGTSLSQCNPLRYHVRGRGGVGGVVPSFPKSNPNSETSYQSFLLIHINNLPFLKKWRQYRLAAEETSRCPIHQLNIHLIVGIQGNIFVNQGLHKRRDIEATIATSMRRSPEGYIVYYSVRCFVKFKLLKIEVKTKLLKRTCQISTFL
jgi:hypothetical protein